MNGFSITVYYLEPCAGVPELTYANIREPAERSAVVAFGLEELSLYRVTVQSLGIDVESRSVSQTVTTMPDSKGTFTEESACLG